MAIRRARTTALAASDTGRYSEHRIQSLLERVRNAGEGDQVYVRDIVAALGPASFGPLMLVPALLVFSPLSGVPGVSSICGISIALIAVQWPLGRSHIWLPGWIERRQLRRDRISRAIDALQRPVAVLDSITRQRLHVLVHPPASLCNELVCLLCGLIMPLLELVPLSSSVLGLAVALLAVSSITRDGVFAALGYAVIAFGAYGIFMLLHFI